MVGDAGLFHVSSAALVGGGTRSSIRTTLLSAARHARLGESISCAPMSKGRGRAVYPSLANFVLIDTGRTSAPIYDKLLRAVSRAAEGPRGPSETFHSRLFFLFQYSCARDLRR